MARSTRTTRRPHEAVLPRTPLPYMTIKLIAQHLLADHDHSALINLLLVSHETWKIVTPLLYRHVVLNSENAYFSFFHVLVEAVARTPGSTPKMRVKRIFKGQSDLEKLPPPWIRFFTCMKHVERMDMLKMPPLGYETEMLAVSTSLGHGFAMLELALPIIGMETLMPNAKRLCVQHLQRPATTSGTIGRQQLFRVLVRTKSIISPVHLCIRESDSTSRIFGFSEWDRLESVYVHSGNVKLIFETERLGIDYTIVPSDGWTKERFDPNTILSSMVHHMMKDGTVRRAPSEAERRLTTWAIKSPTRPSDRDAARTIASRLGHNLVARLQTYVARAKPSEQRQLVMEYLTSIDKPDAVRLIEEADEHMCPGCESDQGWRREIYQDMGPGDWG